MAFSLCRSTREGKKPVKQGKKRELTNFKLAGIICKTKEILNLRSILYEYFERVDFRMREKKIRLGAADVTEFVKAAETCDFDVDISYDRVVIDAKSIVGVFSMDLSKVLTVKYGGQNPEFENLLQKFAIAS